MKHTLFVSILLVAGAWLPSAHAITVDLPPSLPAITQGQPVTINAAVVFNLPGETSILFDIWTITGLAAVFNGGPSITLTGAQTASLPVGSIAVGYTAVSNGFNVGSDTTSLQINPVPEPSTFVLAGVGLIAAAVRRRRQLAAQADDADPDLEL